MEMTSAKWGTNYGALQRKGQAWFCTTGLPSDITIEVDEMLFHLHKFPLISRSGRLARLVAEARPGAAAAAAAAAADDDDDDDDDSDGDITKAMLCISLHAMPGGPEAFELAAKFCYGVKVEVMASNVAALRCAAEYLEMTEEYGDKNLIALTENFLNQVVVKSWKDSIRALKTCEPLLPLAEELQIVKRCVDSLTLKACTDPSFFGWPMTEKCSLQSPDGTLLWNGISTGARPRNSRFDWWYEDISTLSLPLFKCVILSMEERGLRSECIAGAVMYHAKKCIPGLSRRGEEEREESGYVKPSKSRAAGQYGGIAPSEAEQVYLLETMESLLPMEGGVVPIKFLSGMLRIAIILNASSACKASLEGRIARQLEEATLDDLLIPSYSHTQETLYDIDRVQRIVEHFVGGPGKDRIAARSSSSRGESEAASPPPLDVAVVSPPAKLRPKLVGFAKVWDAYLAEVAPDASLKPSGFRALAEALPDHARVLDDGLYRAVDVYLKAHAWLGEREREEVCSVLDCQKLSLEACTHVAQNERLPLRTVVQVLFLEHLQLRDTIAGCLGGGGGPIVGQVDEVSAPSITSPPPYALRAESGGAGANTAGLSCRVAELERECAQLRRELRGSSKPSSRWAAIPAKLGCRLPLEDVVPSGPPHVGQQQQQQPHQRQPIRRKNGPVVATPPGPASPHRHASSPPPPPLSPSPFHEVEFPHSPSLSPAISHLSIYSSSPLSFT